MKPVLLLLFALSVDGVFPLWTGLKHGRLLEKSASFAPRGNETVHHQHEEPTLSTQGPVPPRWPRRQDAFLSDSANRYPASVAAGKPAPSFKDWRANSTPSPVTSHDSTPPAAPAASSEEERRPPHATSFSGKLGSVPSLNVKPSQLYGKGFHADLFRQRFGPQWRIAMNKTSVIQDASNATYSLKSGKGSFSAGMPVSRGIPIPSSLSKKPSPQRKDRFPPAFLPLVLPPGVVIHHPHFLAGRQSRPGLLAAPVQGKSTGIVAGTPGVASTKSDVPGLALPGALFHTTQAVSNYEDHHAVSAVESKSSDRWETNKSLQKIEGKGKATEGSSVIRQSPLIRKYDIPLDHKVATPIHQKFSSPHFASTTASNTRKLLTGRIIENAKITLAPSVNAEVQGATSQLTLSASNHQKTYPLPKPLSSSSIHILKPSHPALSLKSNSSKIRTSGFSASVVAVRNHKPGSLVLQRSLSQHRHQQQPIPHQASAQRNWTSVAVNGDRGIYRVPPAAVVSPTIMPRPWGSVEKAPSPGSSGDGESLPRSVTSLMSLYSRNDNSQPKSPQQTGVPGTTSEGRQLKQHVSLSDRIGSLSKGAKHQHSETLKLDQRLRLKANRGVPTGDNHPFGFPSTITAQSEKRRRLRGDHGESSTRNSRISSAVVTDLSRILRIPQGSTGTGTAAQQAFSPNTPLVQHDSGGGVWLTVPGAEEQSGITVIQGEPLASSPHELPSKKDTAQLAAVKSDFIAALTRSIVKLNSEKVIPGSVVSSSDTPKGWELALTPLQVHEASSGAAATASASPDGGVLLSIPAASAPVAAGVDDSPLLTSNKDSERSSNWLLEAIEAARSDAHHSKIISDEYILDLNLLAPQEAFKKAYENELKVLRRMNESKTSTASTGKESKNRIDTLKTLLGNIVSLMSAPK